MFKEVADIKTADQLNLNVPEAEFVIGRVQPSEAQKAMVDKLAERAKRVREGGVSSDEDNIEHMNQMKLKIYEDLAGGFIDKQEYVMFREQYRTRIEEKSAALERIRKERKDAMVSGETERVWVTLFRQHENIEEVNRRVLMALIDKIFIYEGHALDVIFRYGDEYRRMNEFVERHADLLPSGDMPHSSTLVREGAL